MDMKKEIKLSDLFGRKDKDAPAEEVTDAAAEPKKSRFARKPKAEKAEQQPKAAKASKPKRSRRPSEMQNASLGRRGKKLVGLKIGASKLAAARVVNSGGVPELVQVAQADLEPGIVVGGELRDPDALAEALKTFFKKHKLPRQGVRLGIANNRIGVRTFDLPGVDDEQLHNAVRFRAQEALPIPLEEAVVDYHVLSDTVNDEGVRVRRVLLVVAYRELVDRYVAACRKAGIKLAGIDLEGFAALRALSGGDEAQANAALVVASVGHDRSTLAVSNGSICEFTRVMEWGGQNLSVAIARVLDMTPSEAEPIKHSVSLLEPAEAWAALTGEQAVKVREAIVHEKPGVFPRADLLAPVLPGPARFPRHRRDRPLGRRPVAGHRRRAQPHDRRAGPRGRSTESRPPWQEAFAVPAIRLARSRDRPRDRGP